jgi:hypothetical protein
MKKLVLLMVLVTLLQSCSKDVPVVQQLVEKKENVIINPPVTNPQVTNPIIVDTIGTKLKENLISYYSFSNNVLDSNSNNFDGKVSGNLQYTTDRFGNQNSAISTKNGFVSIFKKELITAEHNWKNLSWTWKWNFSENEKWTTPIQFDRDSTLRTSYKKRGWEANNGWKFSVSLWVKIEDEIDGRILSTEATNMETKKEFGNFNIVYTKGGNIKIHFGEDLNIKVPTKEWVNITYTYDNRNQKVYVNGKLIIDNYNNGKTALSWNITQYNYTIHYRAPLGIGGKALNGMDLFNGCIDDVRIYNKSLDVNEVNYLFKK